MPSKIALDTSFLIFLSKRKIKFERVFQLFDAKPSIYTSRGVLNELSSIASSRRSDAKYASLALKLVSHINPTILPSTAAPDEWLLTQKIIATADIRLAREARKRGIRVISITKSNKIVIT